MRIAFDATAVLDPMSKNRGIGNYSISQFTTMINTDQNNEYFFLNLFDSDFSLKEHLSSNTNVKECILYTGKDQFLLKNKEYEHVIGDIVKKFIAENSIDVFYVTSPFNSHSLLYHEDWFVNCKTVAIVYDIIPYVMKSHYLGDKTTYKWYMQCIDMLRWMDQIQVISQSVKDDLISYLKFDADKIKVIWGAVDKRFCEVKIESSIQEELFQKFGIKGRYIMCTGGDDERKNIAKLIEAYAALPKDILEKYQLVIVCKLSPDAVQRYTEMAVRLKLSNRLVLTNFVSDEELLYLYNLAVLMAFPSTYEGFGLPVVEAWACGTPVLTSNNSSLVQIAGDGAVTVDPHSTKDITRGLEYALSKCDLPLLLENGKKRLELFQWEKVAAASVEGISQIYDADKNLSPKEKAFIAFFTPLPPIQSGISDYSVDIIKALQQYYNIDIYIDKGYTPSVNFGNGVTIAPYKAFTQNASKYKDIIYQVGNSTYHLYMYEYIKKYSGIVVLHDYNMHSVLAHNALSGLKQDYELYRQYLLEDYSSDEVDKYIQKLRNGQCGYYIHEWETNGVATNYAKKIIVHSFDAKQKLLAKNISNNVRQIWSFAEINPKASNTDKKLLKEKFGFNSNDVIFAAFGHVHETKRALPILEAFKRLSEDYPEARLIYVGKLADELKPRFNTALSENGLAHTVKVTGYTSLEDFETYMNLTDVCLNLRYPYNGETSASLIRNLVKGNLVIVNDIGSFGELPEDTCMKLPNVAEMSETEEIEQIYLAMTGIFKMPEKCEIMKKNAAAFSERHLDVNKAAREYYAYIEAPCYNSVSENILQKIAQTAAQNADASKEMNQLAETLTWLKEPDKQLGGAHNISKICHEKDFTEMEPYIRMLPPLQQVYPDLNIPNNILHRKVWEWAFIYSTLEKNNMLQTAKKGLGFAVGCEPLPALFAGLGCEILASDFWEQEDNEWSQNGQNLQGNIDGLNKWDLCPPDLFSKNVAMANIDMNHLPADLKDFDFCWSSCAIEHLGSLDKGKSFFYDHIKVLRKGGIAVHTIEFNTGSNDRTIESGDTVLFRKRDIEEIAANLQLAGCKIICDFSYGLLSGDLYVDKAPYYTAGPHYHLHLDIGGYNCTSYGLIIQKC